MEKEFICSKADKEALEWVSKNFQKIKGFKVKDFRGGEGSHIIVIEYQEKKAGVKDGKV